MAMRVALDASSGQHRLVRAFFADKLTVSATLLVATVLLAAIFAPVVAPADPFAQSLENRLTPPFTTAAHILGTDQLGRDELSRLIYAGRISLTLGFAGVLVSGLIGVFLGLLAGYLRGA